MTHYVRLVFLGDYATMRRAIRSIREDILGVTTMFNKMAALGPAAVGVALSAIPLAFGALGLAATFETEKVKKAYIEFVNYITLKTAELAKPFEAVWLHMFENAKATFDRISPILAQIFEHTAPFVQRLSDHILRAAEHAMPAFLTIVQRTSPLIDTLGVGIEKVSHGFMQMLLTISEETPAANEALGALFEVISSLLPIFGQIIAVLVEGWAPVLGEITFSIEKLAFAFLDFATHMAAAGPAISSIMQTMLGLFAGLFKVLGPLIETFLNALAPVLKEAANLVWMLADTIGAILAPILTALSGPLTAVIKALAEGLRPALFALEAAFQLIMPPLTAVLDGLGRLLVGAIQILAPLLPPIIHLLGEFVAVLLRFIEPLIQIALKLQEAFGTIITTVIEQGVLPLMEVLVQLAEDLLPVVIFAIGQLADIFIQHLAPVLVEVARTVFPALIEVIKTLVPILVDIAAAVLPQVVSIFGQLMPIVAELARIIFPLLADILTEVVVPVIRDVLGPALLAIAEHVLPAVMSVFRDLLVPLLRDVVVPAIRWVADVFRDYVIPFLRDTVIPFLNATLIPAIEFVGTTITAMKDAIILAAEKVVEFFQGTKEKTEGFTQDIKNAWEFARKAMEGEINLMDIANQFLVTKTDEALQFFAHLGDRFKTWWANPRYETRIFIEDVVAFFRDLPGKIVDALLPMDTKLDETFSGAFRKAAEGMKRVGDEIIAWVKTIPDQIVAAMTGFGDRMYQGGANIMSSFKSGMESMKDSVTGTAGTIMQGVRDFFPSSPAKVGPFAGAGYTEFSGQKMIQDFARGLQSVDLSSMISNILSTAQTALGIGPGGGTASASIAGVGSIELKVAPGADSALASLLMNMVRSGQLQLQRV
jgi:phage-related protein